MLNTTSFKRLHFFPLKLSSSHKLKQMYHLVLTSLVTVSNLFIVMCVSYHQRMHKSKQSFFYKQQTLPLIAYHLLDCEEEFGHESSLLDAGNEYLVLSECDVQMPQSIQYKQKFHMLVLHSFLFLFQFKSNLLKDLFLVHIPLNLQEFNSIII